MAEIVGGILEVGCDDNDQVVINHPDLKPDENGVGHIVFSVQQARALADLLRKKAADAENSIHMKAEAERIKNLPPVDRSKRTLTDGSPVTDDHRELLASGQQKGYVVLSAEERAKEECRVMVNAALLKLIDDAGGVITVSTSELFRVAQNGQGTLAMSMSDDDKILTLTRLKVAD